MANQVTQYIYNQQLFSARVAASANQAGSYFNGPLNNGVGATLTFAAGLTAIDSVTLLQYDRVLLFGQTSANQNGIYLVLQTGTPTVLVRVEDFQDIEQLRGGQYLSVFAGTVLAGSVFVLCEPLPGAMGIDPITFKST